MSNVPIQYGQVQNPYREFEIVIAAGQTEKIAYDFNYFRVMSVTGSGLKVRFGGSGEFTSIIGGGFGLELPQAIPAVFLQNSGASPITVTIGLAIGKISDDRANVSGTVSVDIISQSGLNPIQVNDAAAITALGNVQSAIENSVNDLTGVVSTPLAAGVATLVTPAANTAGIMVRNLNCSAWGGYGGWFIGTTVPSAYNDFTKPTIGYTVYSGVTIIDTPFIIPAGNGLYSGASSCNGAIHYEVL